MKEILAKLMKDHGYSQTDVADKTGLGQSTVSDILNGAKRTSEKSLRKLAECFGVSVDFLLGIEKSPNLSELGLSKIDSDIMQLVTQLPDEAKSAFLVLLQSKTGK